MQPIHSPSPTFFISTLQIEKHLLQLIHFSSSNIIPKNEILLKSEYIAPKGHTNLQKILNIKILPIKKTIKKNIFSTNKNPTKLLKFSFFITRGIPASKVPCGHKNLQNPGIEKNRGIKITKKINITYFKYFSFSVYLFFFIFFVFYKISCNKPKGHKKPHINLPNKIPKNKRRPII